MSVLGNPLQLSDFYISCIVPKDYERGIKNELGTMLLSGMAYLPGDENVDVTPRESFGFEKLFRSHGMDT